MIWRPAALLYLLALLAQAVFAVSCTPSSVRAQVPVAVAISRATNPAATAIAESYTRQGELLIDQAHSRKEALALLEAHRKRWRPLWAALDALAAAHNAWATSLEQGRSDAEAATAVLTAWCELEEAAAELDVALPEVVSCP